MPYICFQMREGFISECTQATRIMFKGDAVKKYMEFEYMIYEYLSMIFHRNLFFCSGTEYIILVKTVDEYSDDNHPLRV